MGIKQTIIGQIEDKASWKEARARRARALPIFQEVVAQGYKLSVTPDKENIVVRGPQTVTDDIRDLIKGHKGLLLELLGSPPPPDPSDTHCIRGHLYRWVQDETGAWICDCYFSKDAQLLAQIQAEERGSEARRKLEIIATPNLTQYWTGKEEN